MWYEENDELSSKNYYYYLFIIISYGIKYSQSNDKIEEPLIMNHQLPRLKTNKFILEKILN